jgi:SWI/SNF-related matrix-associated actin-dependent regulator of chromatin subfamily A-like protein 1
MKHINVSFFWITNLYVEYTVSHPEMVDMKTYVFIECISPHVFRCSFSDHLIFGPTLYAEMIRLGFEINDIPDELVKMFSAPRFVIDEYKLHHTQSYHHLRSYQRDILRGLLIRGGRAFNMSEMGTGKTAVAICFMEYYGVEDVLIICPSSTRQNMANEISRFTTYVPNIVKTGKSEIPYGINIVSFDLVKCLDRTKSWTTILVDESHYIKSTTSQRTRYVTHLTRRAQNVLLMSGTPSSRPVDLYSQLRVIYPDVFAHFTKHVLYPRSGGGVDKFYFGDRYCKPTKTYYGRGKYKYTFDGSDMLHEVYAIMSHVGVRCTKTQVLALPVKTRNIHTIHEMNAAQYGQTMNLIRNTQNTRGKLAGQSEISKLVQKHSQTKVKWVEKYLIECVIPLTHKYIIFAHHTKMMSMVKRVCQENQIPYIYIDGTTSTTIRQSLIDTFNDSPKHMLAVLSIKACGVGLNITGAHHVIFAEQIWCDKSMFQAEDRVHRSGQTKPVTIDYLTVKNSIDDLIIRTIVNKQRKTSLAIDNVVMDHPFIQS